MAVETHPRLRVDGAVLSDIGQSRAGNEDAVYLEADPARIGAAGVLCLVADGLGGHAAGEVASDLTVRTVRDVYYGAADSDPALALRSAIATANAAIRDLAARDPARQGMGSTASAVVVRDNVITVAHVGDSRAYLVRGDLIRPLTRDHSFVAEQIARGLLSRDQAERSPFRNVLTRVLGHTDSVEVDLFQEPAQPGDVIVICSDGLHGSVDDATIAQRATALPPPEAAQALVQLALANGSRDNITVAILHLTPDPTAPGVPVASGYAADGARTAFAAATGSTTHVAAGQVAQGTPAAEPAAPSGHTPLAAVEFGPSAPGIGATAPSLGSPPGTPSAPPTATRRTRGWIPLVSVVVALLAVAGILLAVTRDLAVLPGLTVPPTATASPPRVAPTGPAESPPGVAPNPFPNPFGIAQQPTQTAVPAQVRPDCATLWAWLGPKAQALRRSHGIQQPWAGTVRSDRPVNVRSWPEIERGDGNVLGTIPADTSVCIIGWSEGNEYERSRTWYQILFQRDLNDRSVTIGFIHSSVVTIQNADRIPRIPAGEVAAPRSSSSGVSPAVVWGPVRRR